MVGSGRLIGVIVIALAVAMLGGGLPWPIEDPSPGVDGANNVDGMDMGVDTTHPMYMSIGEAMSGAQRYVDILSELQGYPDPVDLLT